ncbi:hypothetical protein TNCV_1839411 [Trichonephila clavipes]|nr:hypothetical protein TNCV_1839411 [Trichonephila clavipes]
MIPGMDPQRGLWNCAISTLVQRSSGNKLLGRDLYEEIRLKAKNSFRSRSGPSRGEFFTNTCVCVYDHNTFRYIQLLFFEACTRHLYPRDTVHVEVSHLETEDENKQSKQ